MNTTPPIIILHHKPPPLNIMTQFYLTSMLIYMMIHTHTILYRTFFCFCRDTVIIKTNSHDRLLRFNQFHSTQSSSQYPVLIRILLFVTIYIPNTATDIEQLSRFPCGGYSDESTIVYMQHPCVILTALEVI